VELAPDADPSPDPARIWTTIATGQPVERHGVRALEARRVPGVDGTMPVAASGASTAIRNVTDVLRLTRPAIVSGSERRARTFWEIASAAGLRTAVVNWWVTWPASSLDGVVLSDRATLRLEHGGELDAELSAATLYAELRQQWPAIKSRAGQIARDALAARSADADSALLQRSASLDALQLGLLNAVSSSSTDLAIVYLPGLDIAQHALIGEQATAVAASTLSARLRSVEDYYAALDRLLSADGAIEPRGDEVVVIVTQPGRIGANLSGRLAVRGRLVPANRSSGALTDVAATLLHALGLPIAGDLAGRPLTGVFSPEFASSYPVRFVETYGEPRRRPDARTGAPLDREMIERLRALVYIR
jgi:hypothetical protein